MQIKIGQIYKVKPEFRDVCWNFSKELDSVYVRYLEKTMDVFDKNKQIISKNTNEFNAKKLSPCFKPKHLEPLEKTLYNLEIGDEIIDKDGFKQKVLGLVESSPENPIYILSSEIDFLRAYSDIWTAYELRNKGFTIVQPEPTEEIKEMTVEEVSKLVGKKVKIVE